MAGKQKWDDSLYFEAYEFAKEGYTDKQIAEIIGVTPMTFVTWRKRKPLLTMGLKMARRKKHEPAPEWRDTVYHKIPERLRPLWDDLFRLYDMDRDPRKRKSTSDDIDRLFENRGEKARQQIYVYALVALNWNLTAACKFVGISNATVNRWRTNDRRFDELLAYMKDAQKDWVESKLMQLIHEGNASAIMFAAKTLLKDRGYNEKIDVNVSGSVDLNVNVIKIEDLNLPLEVKRQVLEAWRASLEDSEPEVIESHVVDNGDDYEFKETF